MDTTATPPATRQLGKLEIEDLLKCLPHRYPFLMIDKIVDIDGDLTAVGIKNITYNEPIFQGHFPDNPVFPGVLIIEGMAQTAGATVIAYDSLNVGEGKTVVLLITIDKAKFRKPAKPGDTLEYHIRKLQRRRNVGRYEARAIVDGVVVAEAEVGAIVQRAE